MRVCVTALVGMTLAMWANDARAQRAPMRGATSFVVKFKKIADDCPKPQLRLTKAAVTVSVLRPKRGRMAIAPGPTLTGKLGPAGDFNMTTRRRGSVITASGRMHRGRISMLVIAEYYRGRNPVCTQTWNAKGKVGKLRPTR